MFRIGDFSRLGRISIRTLRHYDALGLLAPSHTDASTGYRWYTLEQLSTLRRIVALKDLGFSLPEVRTLLQDDLSVEALKELIREKQDEVRLRLEIEEKRLKGLDERLRQLEAGKTRHYDVALKALPPLTTLSRYETVPHLSQMDVYCAELSASLWSVLELREVTVRGNEFLLYHTDGYQLADVEVEICIALEDTLGQLELPSGFSLRHLPALQDVASLIHYGYYAELEEAAEALIFWAGANGYTSSGALREVHLSGAVAHLGKDVPVVTELQLPVTPVQTA